MTFTISAPARLHPLAEPPLPHDLPPHTRQPGVVGLLRSVIWWNIAPSSAARDSPISRADVIAASGERRAASSVRWPRSGPDPEHA
ncbi:hypothetical protein OHO83_29585 [Streptomyces sp. NBC_00569]|nr:hypothetical protein [Streptomyces sp. NBC_00569]WUB96114.1 hypothetical protein OHO83_29585 [Streptomyces sp. NBC_00569]